MMFAGRSILHCAVAFASILAAQASAQGPEFGMPSRSDAQQRYVDRMLAMPPPQVRVIVDDKWLEHGGPKNAARKGILFGSMGVSVGWSMGAHAVLPRLSLRRKDGKLPFDIFLGDPGGSLFNTRIQADLSDAGEKIGLMSYGAFRVDLEAGDYELVGADAWKMVYRGHPQNFPPGKFAPIAFSISPEKPAYLGRITFVPQIEEVKTRYARSAQERAMMDDRPEYDISGVFVWVQDALESDRQLAEAGAGEVFMLPPLLLQANPQMFRTRVTAAQIDHDGKSVNAR